MENATKALLIAGSVLIAIVLIAVGIKILGSTSGTVNQVESVSNAMEKSIFNSQYTQFEGAQKGTAVKKLINQAKTYNATVKDANKKIKITTVANLEKGLERHDNVDSEAEVNGILDEIQVSYNYTVSIQTNPNTGFVNSIEVK